MCTYTDTQTYYFLINAYPNHPNLSRTNIFFRYLPQVYYFTRSLIYKTIVLIASEVLTRRIPPSPPQRPLACKERDHVCLLFFVGLSSLKIYNKVYREILVSSGHVLHANTPVCLYGRVAGSIIYPLSV